jgi:hypothetical protein
LPGFSLARDYLARDGRSRLPLSHEKVEQIVVNAARTYINSAPSILDQTSIQLASDWSDVVLVTSHHVMRLIGSKPYDDRRLSSASAGL